MEDLQVRFEEDASTPEKPEITYRRSLTQILVQKGWVKDETIAAGVLLGCAAVMIFLAFLVPVFLHPSSNPHAPAPHRDAPPPRI